MRTAIYARFSTELQQERSIEDQFELCRAHAAKNGLDVVAVYDDRARSGASIFGRDGLMRMMDAARDGAFDVILVEALDRLSRDQEDLAGLWKRLVASEPSSTPSARRPFQVKATVTQRLSVSTEAMTSAADCAFSRIADSQALPPAALRNERNSYRPVSAGVRVSRMC